MAQIFKIKFDDTVRRISVPVSENGDPENFCYRDLEMNVRDLFQIPSQSRVLLTYIDKEDDVVLMGNDQDFRDACVMQKLNPLKLEVKAISHKEGLEAKGILSRPNSTELNVEALLKGLFPESTAKAIDQVLSRYPPCLFTTVPAHVLPKALDTFLETLAASSRESTSMWESDDRLNASHVAVHKYIECDRCFMCPIVGPRYKSTKKHDYDLCSECYKKVGNATDYRKLDRPVTPVSSNPPAVLKAGNGQYPLRPVSFGKYGRPSGTICINGGKFVGNTSKFSAEFIRDVTILDGSKVEIGKPFTKIWRFKNDGMLPWPQHTQLVHIGGPSLGSTGFVTLKLPAGGLSCGREIDVSVELLAPEKSGSYVAHWSLMVPSGQKFGHSVWVLIEAVPLCKEYQSESEESEESDLDQESQEFSDEEAEGNVIGCEEETDTDLQAGEAGFKMASVESKHDEPLAEMDGFSLVERLDNQSIQGQELLTGTEDFEMVGPLLDEVDSKKNGTNIEATHILLPEEDSLASTGWDDMLKELEELGFSDTRTDIKELLLKKEGSIKRAVKELVELERQMSAGKIKAA